MSFSSRLALTAATVTAAAATIAAGPPETGFDRPGGIYTNITAKDAAACAIACAQDRICMSWTFRVTEYVGCSLKAVVPPAVADRDAVSGIDDRAGDFLSLVSNAPPTPPPAPAPASVQAAPPPPAALAATEAPAAIATLNPAAMVRRPASDIRQILEVSALVPQNAPLMLPPELEPLEPLPAVTARFSTVARASYRGPVVLAHPAQELAAMVFEAPLPDPLGEPIIVAARFAPVTRVAYRASTSLALPAPEFAALVVDEPPLGLPAPLAARQTPLSRVAFRAPTTLPRAVPEFAPLVSEEPLGPPATLAPRQTLFSRVAYRAPTPLVLRAPEFKPAVIDEPPAPPPAKSLALNDRIVVGLPGAPVEQPSSSVVPVAYVAPDAVAPAASSAPEDELLGAP